MLGAQLIHRKSFRSPVTVQCWKKSHCLIRFRIDTALNSGFKDLECNFLGLQYQWMRDSYEVKYCTQRRKLWVWKSFQILQLFTVSNGSSAFSQRILTVLEPFQTWNGCFNLQVFGTFPEWLEQDQHTHNNVEQVFQIWNTAPNWP